MLRSTMLARIGLAAFGIFAAATGLRAEESLRSTDPNDGWKVATKSNDLIIYSRSRSGSRLKEFKAVGEIEAPSRVVNAVLDDVDSYPRFMPYTVECRLLKRENDSMIAYQRLSPKIVEDRDYTLRIWKKSWPSGGAMAFRHIWSPANEFGPPEKKGVVRVKVCEGGWLLEPDGENKTRATYSVYSDSGGAIPVFIANSMAKVGITKLFAALRKQVKDPKYSANQEGGPQPKS